MDSKFWLTTVIKMSGEISNPHTSQLKPNFFDGKNFLKLE